MFAQKVKKTTTTAATPAEQTTIREKTTQQSLLNDSDGVSEDKHEYEYDFDRSMQFEIKCNDSGTFQPNGFKYLFTISRVHFRVCIWISVK